MIIRMLPTAIAVILMLSSGLGCTFVSDDSSAEIEDYIVEIPEGVAARVDGTLSAEEWEGSRQLGLAGGGALHLMHADGYLYLGLRASPAPVTTVYLDRGEEIIVAHSSAALGTSVYRMSDGDWQPVREFFWSCRDTSHSVRALEERTQHLTSEGWIANTGRMGIPDESEFQIAIGDESLRLAIVQIGAPSYEEPSWWPATVQDSCLSLNLLRGDNPRQLAFNRDQWALVRKAPRD